jgi:hypothetical protein
MTLQPIPAPWQTKAFVPLYYIGESNHCPGCGGTHWEVGRVSAECCREGCHTALPLATQFAPMKGEG